MRVSSFDTDTRARTFNVKGERAAIGALALMVNGLSPAKIQVAASSSHPSRAREYKAGPYARELDLMLPLDTAARHTACPYPPPTTHALWLPKIRSLRVANLGTYGWHDFSQVGPRAMRDMQEREFVLQTSAIALP